MAAKSFLEMLKEKLTPETYAAMLEQAGEDFDFAVVPYSRFAKVIGQRNSARDEVTALKAGAAGADDDDDDGGDGDDDDEGASTKGKAASKSTKPVNVKKAVEDAVAAVRKEYEDKEAATKLREAGLAKLRDAGVIDAELVYDSTKFDKTKLKFGDDGKLTKDADETVAAFKKANPALFGKVDVKTGTGKTAVHEGASEDALEAQLNTLFGVGVGPAVTTVK